MSIKVGDRVIHRRVTCGHRLCPRDVGKEGIVISINADSSNPIHSFKCKISEGEYWNAREDELELVAMTATKSWPWEAHYNAPTSIVNRMVENSFSTTYTKGNTINKPKQTIMSIITNLVKSKEKKALEEFGLINADGTLNDRGLAEFATFLYVGEAKTAFEAKIVEAFEAKKAENK